MFCPKCGEEYSWDVMVCPTCDVDTVDRLPGPDPTPDAALVSILASRRNDLETPAIRLQGIIADVLVALQDSGCLLARMSGSGATCFGLFGSAGAAQDVARQLHADHPGWWVRATQFG